MDRDRCLTASLIYDTREQSIPRGLRTVVQRARCLLYMADEFELLLEVSPETPPDRSRVVGQFSLDGLPYAGATVRLGGPVDHPEQTTDGDGAFRFSLLMSGDYRLTIDTPDGRVDTPPLNL